jgi:hypothetical protein
MRSELESRSDLKLFCEVVLDVQTAATARDNNRESAVGQTRPWDPCSAQVDESASFWIQIMNFTKEQKLVINLLFVAIFNLFLGGTSSLVFS